VTKRATPFVAVSTTDRAPRSGSNTKRSSFTAAEAPTASRV
jgi:hypothetical protein